MILVHVMRLLGYSGWLLGGYLVAQAKRAHSHILCTGQGSDSPLIHVTPYMVASLMSVAKMF